MYMYLNLSRFYRLKTRRLLSSTIFTRSFWIQEGEMASGASSTAVVNPTAKHTATVIFLHGLGDTGYGWCAAFEGIRRPNVRYVFPTAHVIPVTLNSGLRMPSWFDIKGLDPNAPQDEEGIKKASEELKKLIEEEEKRGIPANKIVIGGFSQGGALSLYTALTYPKKLAGVLALSSWLPLHRQFQKSADVHNRDTPILQCHGDVDPVIPYGIGEMTSLTLTQQLHCSKHKFMTYNGMAHSSCNKEMEDVEKWLCQVLNAD